MLLVYWGEVLSALSFPFSSSLALREYFVIIFVLFVEQINVMMM